MSTKITTCPNCQLTNIMEINPEEKKTSMKITCEIHCKCLNCNQHFYIKAATDWGKRKGIRY